MEKVQFLLKNNIENIDVSGLQLVKEEYFNLLKENVFPKAPETGGFYEMINYFKRKNENNPIGIGPYRNITPFEAANRIASDLVIINGLIQLIEKNNLENAILTLRLGTTHVKDKGDFTIKIDAEEFEGEAFNVAPSFLIAKLNKTLRKWKSNKLEYILVNEDAFERFEIEKFDRRIFLVKNWNE